MVDSKVNALALFRKSLEQHEVDVPRELLKVVAEALMSAEADAACGAGYGERSDERVNWRNGYRQRAFDRAREPFLAQRPTDLPEHELPRS